jgi:transposase
MRYELELCGTPLAILPNKPQGLPPVNDRRALEGSFWIRSGAPWRDLRAQARSKALQLLLLDDALRIAAWGR